MYSNKSSRDMFLDFGLYKTRMALQGAQKLKWCLKNILFKTLMISK